MKKINLNEIKALSKEEMKNIMAGSEGPCANLPCTDNSDCKTNFSCYQATGDTCKGCHI